MRNFALIFACSGVLLVSCRSGGEVATEQAVRPGRSGPPSPPAVPSPVLSLSPVPAKTSGRPDFSSEIFAIPAGGLARSWREGCPVPLRDLRLLWVKFWGFDDRTRNGEMVVHRDHASAVAEVMRDLYGQRFAIERMELVDGFGGDDLKSMEANNTSAFNCREITGRPGAWSEHAFGRAIDINPVQNPYISPSGRVSPASGAGYVDRSKRAKGMILPGGPVVRAFRSRGWEWGGEWSSPKDYQHFSATGR